MRYALLASWAGATGAPLDMLIELAQRAKSGTPDWFMPYRQAVIGRAYLTAIIDEHVIRRPVGSAAVMAEQCGHLAGIAGRPRIELHVIPEGTNVGLWGALYLATQDNTVTVCLPAREDVTSTAGHLVGKATWAFERILGAAMPRAESLDLIRTAEGRWKVQI